MVVVALAVAALSLNGIQREREPAASVFAYRGDPGDAGIVMKSVKQAC